MGRETASQRDLKTGEDELLDFEFEELGEDASSDAIEELTSEDIIELVDVVEEGEPLDLLQEGEPVDSAAKTPAERAAPRLREDVLLESPEGEAIVQDRRLQASDEVVEIQPQPVSGDSAAQGIEIDIDEALKRLEIPEGELGEAKAEETPGEAIDLDLEDLGVEAPEEVPPETLEREIEALDLEEGLPVQEETPVVESMEATQVLEAEALEPAIAEATEKPVLGEISEEQILRMAEDMDLRAKVAEEIPEAMKAEALEPMAEIPTTEIKEVTKVEAGEIPGDSATQAEPIKTEAGPAEVPEAPTAEVSGEPATQPAPEPAPLSPMISEEKVEEIITRVVRETVERTVRETVDGVVRETVERTVRDTVAGVAERVITQAIEALKRSLEPNPD
jgi:hypothetical protein